MRQQMRCVCRRFVLSQRDKLKPLQIVQRLFSGRAESKLRKAYIEQWFESIVKSSSFYEDNANALPIRRYFYNVDLQGRLFLEETLPKNIATSLKDARFLDFFFRRLRKTTTAEVDLLETNGIRSDEYPFVSPCGRELNFIRPAATPIVFHSLVNSDSDDDDHQHNLVYGGSLTIPFDPARLAISNHTGRLYHQFVGRKEQHKSVAESSNLTITTHSNKKEQAIDYGLVRSSLAVTLAEQMMASTTDDAAEGMELSGMDYVTDKNERVSIPSLPVEAEPGPWAMPTVDDEYDSS